MNATMKREQEATTLAELRDLLTPGDTLYTVLRSVSKSGMFRRMDIYVMKDNRPVWLTGRIAKLISCRYSKNDWRKSAGLGVSGCGMDMGFHVVNTLSSLLYRNVDGSYSHEGAYALKQEWL